MASIERTAYPRFKRFMSVRELHVFYSPQPALLLFLWVRFGGAAQGAGPLLPGQGRLRRRCARTLRAPWTCEPRRPLRAELAGRPGACPTGCAAPPNLGCSGGRR